MEPQWNVGIDSTARAASVLESMKSSRNTSQSAMTKSHYWVLSQSKFRRQDREEMRQLKLVKAPSKSYRSSKPVRSMFLFEVSRNFVYSRISKTHFVLKGMFSNCLSYSSTAYWTIQHILKLSLGVMMESSFMW